MRRLAASCVIIFLTLLLTSCGADPGFLVIRMVPGVMTKAEL